MLRPAPPKADAQRGEHDEQDASQDVRDRHVEDEQVHLWSQKPNERPLAAG